MPAWLRRRAPPLLPASLASLPDNDYGAHWGQYNGSQAFFDSDGTLFAQQAKGVVDVSEWQDNIDWAKAKAAGVQGAIIRLTFGANKRFDQYAQRNISECKRLGIPFGVYLYSYAANTTDANSEGASMVEKLQEAGVKPGDMQYPVFYDLERWIWSGHNPPSDPDTYTAMVDAWWAQLQAKGYTNLSVYSYPSYLNTALNSSSIHARTHWVASYGPRPGFTYTTNDRGWQYTSNGKVDGFSGSVDLNAFGVLNSTDAVAVYRVYNPNSGLHHYTTSLGEKNSLVKLGWKDEGVSFNAAKQGSASGLKPVYREYNPYNGTHNWTLSSAEHEKLVSLGWRDEGVAWYANPAGAVTVYRLYNPYSGEHVYTTSAEEYAKVGAAGWRQEGVAWQGL
ncbi:MAG: glycoside hydrolase family 25 protein [Bifidobacterium tibiigranuli]|nr:glycoside hydrolase family 25 protein [Bifidobacterium tibiigranuli]